MVKKRSNSNLLNGKDLDDKMNKKSHRRSVRRELILLFALVMLHPCSLNLKFKI